MCRSEATYQSSPGQDQVRYHLDESIGDLFREHGEDYIKKYKPPLQHIKLIRAVRICKTPALGGKGLVCEACGKITKIYFSCGHSHCPLCQDGKRQIWQENLTKKLYNVPYVHGVFTTPKELHSLMRANKREMYNIVMRASYQTIKTLTADPKNVGGLPGVVMVLHTFGSDMKYHVHVHALITFGALDADNNWLHPVRKKRLASCRDFCRTYRETFIKMVRSGIKNGKLNAPENIESVLVDIEKKRWNVRMEYPTTDTMVIERYLGRYINRIAISKSRLKYVKAKEEVSAYVDIRYKDYRNQKKGEAAEHANKRVDPIVAIGQFLQHVLPPYFQKCRYYGLHSPTTYRRLKDKIPKAIIRNKATIKRIFEILTLLNKQPGYQCDHCKGEEFEVIDIRPDKNWKFNFITLPNYRDRAPPIKREYKADIFE